MGLAVAYGAIARRRWRIDAAVIVAALATALSQYPNLKYGGSLAQERRLLDQFFSAGATPTFKEKDLEAIA